MISLARLKVGERQTERAQTARIDRCRGGKRDHLSTLLPAEECLSLQAAQYETGSQLQLMAKMKHMLRLHCCSISLLRSSSRSRGRNKLIYGLPEPSIPGAALQGSPGTLSVSGSSSTTLKVDWAMKRNNWDYCCLLEHVHWVFWPPQ